MVNPLTRKIIKNPLGSKRETFRSEHSNDKHINKAVAPKNAFAKQAQMQRQADVRRKKADVSGPGIVEKEKLIAKKTLPRGNRQEQLNRQRIGDVAADFLLRRQEQQKQAEKTRQKKQSEKDLYQIQQRRFFVEQKVKQLSSEARRNGMEKVHIAGLVRKYQTDVDRYKTEIAKLEGMLAEYKKELRRNMRDQVLPKKIKLTEGSMKRINTLLHGVETKIKLQEETSNERDRRQKSLERDVSIFSKEVEDLEKKEHQLQQQVRFLGM